jgi:hypothetical protein
MQRVNQRNSCLVSLAGWLVDYASSHFRDGHVNRLDVVISCRVASLLLRLDRWFFYLGLVG